MKKLKVGIIGVGNMGSSHAENNVFKETCPEIELVAICDTDPERRAWAQEKFAEKNVAIFADAEAMFAAKICEAVIIATPHYDHPVLAMQAFANGLHVLTEKPAGVYTKNVREMDAAAKKAGLVFGVMFQCRTIPAVSKMKEIIASGSFGQIRSVSWLVTNWYRSQAYYDSGSWRATWAGEGGGVLLNQCPHQLDMLQWLCGMPEEISATCRVGRWHDIEVEDDVVAVLKYPNGTTGTFTTSTGFAPGTNRLEIMLDKGSLVLENNYILTAYELEETEQEFSRKTKTPFGGPKVTQRTFELEDCGVPAHMQVANAWAKKILHNEGELIACGQDGINELTLSNAMYLSAWTNAPVKLPIDEDLYYEELMKRVATSKHKNVKAVFADTAGTYSGSGEAGRK